MAINPLIALQNQRATPNIQPALNQLVAGIRRGPALQERKTNMQANRLAQQQGMGQEQIARIGNAARIGEQLIPALDAGDMTQAQRILQESERIDPQMSQQGLQMLQQNPQQLRQISQRAIDVNKRIQPQGANKFARTLGTEDIVDPGPDKKFGTDDDFIRKVGVQSTGPGEYRTTEIGRAPKATPAGEIRLFREREEIKTGQTGQRELNKAMAEQFAERQERQGAKSRVTKVLGEANRLYDELDRIGAAVDAEGSSYQNIINRVSASGVGQGVGKLLGTQAQSIRNQINQLRPTLLNEIRQATEMGARGLDSERELQFYMEAVADPGRDIQSNKAALQTLSEAYGMGLDLDVPGDKKQILKAEWDAKKGSFSTTEGEIGFDDQGALRFMPKAKPQGNQQGDEVINWEDLQ